MPNYLLKTIINTIFPINCINCQENDVWICDHCAAKIPQNTIHCCLLCKKQTKLGEFCNSCSHLFHLDKVWIAGDFQDKYLSKLIKLYKYKYAQEISGFLGFFLLDFFKNKVMPGLKIYNIQNIAYARNYGVPKKNILIIPVPLHPKRLRWRGFNQSEKIADIIASNLQIPIDSTSLKRIKFKTPQAKLKKEDRIKNISNNFNWHGNKLNQQNIILIDDVTTTGATLNECAKVLKANGAKEVWGLVLANG